MPELMIIGSGCGIPLSRYGPPCFALKEENNTIIIDIGYDNLYKILNYVNVNEIKNIFITHTHPDHFWGLLPLCFYLKCLTKSNKHSSINVYGHERIGIFLSFIKNFYDWFEKKPDVNFFNVSAFDGRQIECFNFHVLKTNHSIDSYAFKFIYQDKIFVYTGDTEYSNELVNFAKDAYILVCECSFIKNGSGHIDIDSFKKISIETRAKKVVLVHNYRESGYDVALMELKRELKESLVIGEDGLSINF
jgi:ribonuclease BN (tRNA processing enzyme)